MIPEKCLLFLENCDQIGQKSLRDEEKGTRVSNENVALQVNTNQ